MNASLVWDGLNLYIPESMGKPKGNQLTGTELENLGELAGRVCYDSLGQGRSSEQYHQHILEVANTSVYEHCMLNLEIDTEKTDFSLLNVVLACINRKGVWLEIEDPYIEVSINFRAILDWNRHSKRANLTSATEPLGRLFHYYGAQSAPMIFGIQDWPEVFPTQTAIHELDESELTDDQAMITLYLYGSRGFSHEQVRHRFAISQRSTRYVDEDGSPYIQHPLVTKFLTDESLEHDPAWHLQVEENGRQVTTTEQLNINEMIHASIKADRQTYRNLVRVLQRYCVEKLGITDKTTARKQARGAARGYLGNALATDMLFTTSVEGWRWILKNRKNKAADAEIRQVYSPGLEALKASQYGDRFRSFELVPSPDGIGTVLA